MWLTRDKVSRVQESVSMRSRRYAEWLNLAYKATVHFDPHDDIKEEE